MYRWITIGAATVWLAAMSSLFMRDIWPALSAQDAPPMRPVDLAEGQRYEQQYGIFSAKNERLGTAWSNLEVGPELTSLRGTIVLTRLPVLPPLRIETITDFDREGLLDTFSLQVHGIRLGPGRRAPQARVHVHGERRGIYFPVEMQFGPIRREANLDMAASRWIGDSLRPFSFLPTLQVGQSWRMQLLDPLAAAMGGQTQFKSIIARVTRRETIEHQGRSIACFVVETSPDKVIAWVGPDGHVLMQQVEMPMLGEVTVRDEPYNQADRFKAKRHIGTSSEDDQRD